MSDAQPGPVEALADADQGHPQERPVAEASLGSSILPQEESPDASAATVAVVNDELTPPADLDAEEQEAWLEYQQKLAASRARKAALEATRLAEAAGVRVRTEVAVADGWYIDASNTPPVLLLEEASEPAATLALTEGTLAELLTQLNSFYILPDEEPVRYQVRIPDVANAQPIFSLVRGGAVLASMTMDEEFNQNVGSILRAMYPQRSTTPWFKRAKAWVRAHKVATGFLVLVSLPVLIVLGQGIFYSIASIFN